MSRVSSAIPDSLQCANGSEIPVSFDEEHDGGRTDFVVETSSSAVTIGPSGCFCARLMCRFLLPTFVYFSLHPAMVHDTFAENDPSSLSAYSTIFTSLNMADIMLGLAIVSLSFLSVFFVLTI